MNKMNKILSQNCKFLFTEGPKIVVENHPLAKLFKYNKMIFISSLSFNAWFNLLMLIL